MYPQFEFDIDRMNATYKLPTVDVEGMALRLKQFSKILDDEFREIEDIKTEASSITINSTTADIIRLKTGVADLLADIIVYCASEAKRWQIPLPQVLQIVMASNFSKLGADGQPIMVEGKFQKGPYYWKPEPDIARLLMQTMPGVEITDVKINLDMNEVARVAVDETNKVTQAQASQTHSVGYDSLGAEPHP